MVFNNKLLATFPENQKNMAKVFFILIQEDINPQNLFKEEILAELMEVQEVAVKEKLIIPTYQEDRNLAYTNKHALFVEENVCEEVDYSGREYFLKSYCGIAGKGSTPIFYKNRLDAFIEKYPNICMKDIVKAHEEYVKDCMNSGTYLKLAHNFVMDENGYSTLYSWIEQINEESIEQFQEL